MRKKRRISEKRKWRERTNCFLSQGEDLLCGGDMDQAAGVGDEFEIWCQ
jgi:hypothetical protein